jgi:3-oxoadipate enol-lactonase
MHQMLEVRNGALFVEDTGEPDLPVVLALHSLFLDGRMFDRFVADTAGRFRVVRPDHRGQGRSARVDGPIVTVDECAEDVEALVEAMDLGPVHLLLSSMGGDVGLRFAAKRGELVRSVVVTGSSACAEPEDQLVRFREFVQDFDRRGFMDDLLDLLVEVMFGETTRNDPAKADLVERYRREFAALPRDLTPAFLGVIERASVVHLLPKITAPTLIVSGAEDMPRPPAWADEMHEHLPNSKLWRLPAIGHSPLLEAPELVNPRTLAFFEQVERGATSAAEATGVGADVAR